MIVHKSIIAITTILFGNVFGQEIGPIDLLIMTQSGIVKVSSGFEINEKEMESVGAYKLRMPSEHEIVIIKELLNSEAQCYGVMMDISSTIPPKQNIGSVAKYILDGVNNGRYGLCSGFTSKNIKTAQQVDSAEPSTNAVPPSKLSGSAR